MAFSRLLASWLLLVKMRRFSTAALGPSPKETPHSTSLGLLPNLSLFKPRLYWSHRQPKAPGDVPTMMSLPNSHGGIHVTESLLCQEHLRGHALCDLYIRPVAWLWFSMWQRGNWDWAVDSLWISGTALGYTQSVWLQIQTPPSQVVPWNSSSSWGPVHNLLQNTTQMNTSTR